ncbi:MAG: squalene--hopene cyclase [Tannerella sp.]|jgi:squalene-hopene/tetraprenyl-beta-curcumene cyclase|nr:squalene--hopene cyclase [Tannerella sp.]
MMQTDEMIDALRERLLEKRPSDGSIWRGKLSSSAISTSVSVFALYMVDKEKYASYIREGRAWLMKTMRLDGSWGDSVESPSNMTATLLAYASLCATGAPSAKTKEYLTGKFGGSTDQYIIEGVMAYYGKDLTFSAPVLAMCALAGVISGWDKIPQLPFEASVLPQKFFRFFRLPVVSYAIPALIAVGILRYKKGKKNILSPVRESFIKKSLEVLVKLQPLNGGFLEAAPLTAFVTMCMSGAGYRDHIATQRGAGFLTATVREDGAWPIDTDLAGWVTALSVRVLGDDIKDKQALAEKIKRNAFASGHPFTGAKEGGWAWTDLSGAVPDADDTSGALVALHILLDGVYCPEVGKGIEWLLALQNSDGGMPTFCKGWGKLPFDRSSPDISAHAILAFQMWQDVLPDDLRKKCRTGMLRMLKWMRSIQAADGSWIPLWFGDQDAKDERSPVYGTAMTVEYLAGSKEPMAGEIALKGLYYILSTQNADGGWGGAGNVRSKVTLTARALSALAEWAFKFKLSDGRSSIQDSKISGSEFRIPDSGFKVPDSGFKVSDSEFKVSDSGFKVSDSGFKVPDSEFKVPDSGFKVPDSGFEIQIAESMNRAFDYLRRKYKAGEIYECEPIGLYFSRLWYSEELYNITFVLNALKKFKIQNSRFKIPDSSLDLKLEPLEL